MASIELSPAARVHQRDRARAAASYLAIALGLVSLFAPVFAHLAGAAPALFSGPLAAFPPFLYQISRIYIIFGAFSLFALARYLRSGNRLAWGASILLLALIALFHLGKALDWPLALLSAAGAAWLGIKQSAFPVKPGKVLIRRVLWLGAAVVSLATLIALGLLIHLVKDYSMSLSEGILSLFDSFNVELHERSGHPRLELLVALVLGAFGLILWHWYVANHVRTVGVEEHREARERARTVINQFGGGTLDYFALRDDKEWFFLKDSVVAYAIRGSVCLVSPDPIGPVEQREEIWAEFMLWAEHNGLAVSVLAAGAPWLKIYEGSGLRTVYLGDEAIVDAQRFSLAGKKSKSLRQGHARLVRAGYSVQHFDPLQLPEQMRHRLEELSRESRRGENERGFSMTLSRLFDPADTGLMLSVAIDGHGMPQAFIQWMPAPDVDGWSLDVMRRSTAEQTPGGLMDFIIIETIGLMALQGRRGLGLNFAVLRDAVAEDSKASRIERIVAKQASKHAQVASLWKFNAKYDPDWQPRYAAVGTMDLWLAQGLSMAQAEGLTEIPGLPMPGARSENNPQ